MEAQSLPPKHVEGLDSQVMTRNMRLAVDDKSVSHCRVVFVWLLLLRIANHLPGADLSREKSPRTDIYFLCKTQKGRDSGRQYLPKQ